MQMTELNLLRQLKKKRKQFTGRALAYTPRSKWYHAAFSFKGLAYDLSDRMMDRLGFRNTPNAL